MSGQKNSATAVEERPQGTPAAGGMEALRQSPTMAHLLAALERQEDIGHYGRLVFAMVARHFLDDEELVALLAGQPEHDDQDMRGLVTQVRARDYSPPKRERILEWQSQQEFSILPDPEDPDCGNLYRELQFPEQVYEHIQGYYEEKAAA